MREHESDTPAPVASSSTMRDVRAPRSTSDPASATAGATTRDIPVEPGDQASSAGATARDTRVELGKPDAASGSAGATTRDTPVGPVVPQSPGGGGATTRDDPVEPTAYGVDAHDSEHAKTVLDAGIAAPVDDAPPGGFTRLNLPPPLAARLRLVRELASGAEADVVLAADRATGAEVAVKLFRPKINPTNAMLDALAHVGSPHVLTVLERAEHNGLWWEVMEYLPLGSLTDVIESDPLPWSAPRVLQVVEQIGGALSHSHALGLIHRDVKPQNILVRSLSPFSVVLADYGLSTVVTATRDQRSSSRTAAYAAPEAAFGEVSVGRDWWSLGMTAFELLTGSHPFKTVEGDWLEERQIGRMLYDEPIDVSGVADATWQLFFRGVFQRKSAQRWAAREVIAWLHGDSPTVFEDVAARVQRDVFSFRGVAYDDPRALAAALARDWSYARRLVAGIRAQAAQSLLLVEWLERAGITTLDQLMRAEQPSRTLAKLLVLLDPDMEPVFGPWQLSPDKLAVFVDDASSEEWQGEAAVALDDLYTSGVLSIYARLPGLDSLAAIDERWHSSGDDAQRLTEALPPIVGRLVSDPIKRATRGWLLLAAANDDDGVSFQTYVDEARQSAGMAQPWFAALAAPTTERQDQTARTVLAVMLTGMATDMARKDAAAAEAQRQLELRQEADRVQREREIAAENARREQEMRRSAPHNRLARWSIVVALIFGPLGMLLGAIALYQINTSVQRGRVAATSAIVLGFMTTVLLL